MVGVCVCACACACARAGVSIAFRKQMKTKGTMARTHELRLSQFKSCVHVVYVQIEKLDTCLEFPSMEVCASVLLMQGSDSCVCARVCVTERSRERSRSREVEREREHHAHTHNTHTHTQHTHTRMHPCTPSCHFRFPTALADARFACALCAAAEHD